MATTKYRRARAALLALAIVAAAAVDAESVTAESRADRSTSHDGLTVATSEGRIRGRGTEDHRIFEGIPFARPPVGDLRLRAPRPPARWTGVRDATAPGPHCAQVFTYPPGTPPQFTGSEDCLYLNVHVPRGGSVSKPVMVFVHGGGFASGSGGAYDPRRVSRAGDVIVVTLNYRLGALGFLRHPALHDPAAGNFGIADQQAALRWVQRNITAFGGDAGNVTLWGESAGAYSVCVHLASPGARGLFHRAIVQSGPCANDFLPRREAERRGDAAAHELGCGSAASVIDCLRAVPVQALAGLHADRIGYSRIATDLPWWPVAYTPILPQQPDDTARTGMSSHVPLILGGTRDEMRALIVAEYDGIGAPLTAEAYPGVVADLYGPDTGAVIEQYALEQFPTPSLALASSLTDEGRFQGTCSQLSYLDDARTRGPAYAYEFAEPTGRTFGDFPEGAAHGADVRYFFDSYDRPGVPMSGPQRELADELIAHWTTFARTGAPRHDWTPYRDGIARAFSTTADGLIDLALTHRCDFWDAL